MAHVTMNDYEYEVQGDTMPEPQSEEHYPTQCSEESTDYEITPSAQRWFGTVICTECTGSPQAAKPCNNVAGQSRGPHRQCSEQSCQHLRRWYSPTCTECDGSDGLPCDNVAGQSRGPHLQCSEESFHRVIQQWCVEPHTQCDRPENYQQILLCNSVPVQSCGPHVQSSGKHCNVYDAFTAAALDDL